MGERVTRATARLVERDGFGMVRMAVDGLEVEVVPELSMLGAALRLDGRDHVALHRGLDGYAAGHWTGVPLLHPWANRLAGDRVAVRDSEVVLELADAPLVARDGNGLPMHGTCTALDGWDVDLLEIDEGGDGILLEGSLDFAARADLMVTFPFAHRLVVRWEVLGAGHPEGEADPVVRVTTTVAPTGADAVPVCFGWHPYLCLPGVPRDEWRLVLPEREHLLLDDRGLPTGEVVEEPAEADPLAGRTFDDAYRLGRDRTLALEAGDRRTEVRFGAGYPYAQIYAPGDAAVVALEPMAAPAGALATGEHPWAEPGGAFDATFTLRVR